MLCDLVHTSGPDLLTWPPLPTPPHSLAEWVGLPQVPGGADPHAAAAAAGAGAAIGALPAALQPFAVVCMRLLSPRLEESCSVFVGSLVLDLLQHHLAVSRGGRRRGRGVCGGGEVWEEGECGDSLVLDRQGGRRRGMGVLGR